MSVAARPSDDSISIAAITSKVLCIYRRYQRDSSFKIQFYYTVTWNCVISSYMQISSNFKLYQLDEAVNCINYSKLWLCLWELWHFVIYLLQLINECIIEWCSVIGVLLKGVV